ncbi:bleomycin hydrolase [Niveomyces insectorum RCEF 264]|uniref:Cysteine proteinase 1, mitochondrial n=1 Tax=Niveomyces insectorum RCEF 264 TaxID=1081102 RepID=A0A162IF59_9HYPO|nr:bleomycin hydrolase [Niveomyces insectorum RCEF 264]
MGSTQSKGAPDYASREKTVSNLRAGSLNTENGSGDEKSAMADASGSTAMVLHRTAEGLSALKVLEWQTELLDDPKNKLALAALTANDPKKLLLSRDAAIVDQQVFNVRIPFEGGPVANQRSSGRCWLFASTNVFRVALMQKYELEAFELSQAYLFFWDKLEKCNYFLEQILDTADLDLDSRLVQTLVGAPISDGGQWDMVRNLVVKYGLVPQVLYPDSYNAMASSTINQIVATKLREGALVLRGLLSRARFADEQALSAALATAKAKILHEIHAVLTLTLGPPPAANAEFTWSFVDRRGRTREVRSTPLAFAADIYSSTGGPLRVTAATVDRMVSLVHDPRHEPLSLLRVDRLGNVVGGRGITYVNVAMPQLKAACVAMLRAGLPVFFGCDVGKHSDRVSGLMDLNIINYELGLGVSVLGMDKAERLRTGESAMTHAMVLTAVHLDGTKADGSGGVPVRWRVQNSWGEEPGDHGWFLMTDAWMDDFVYQAVVDPRFLPREIADVLEKEPITLPLWDPMGALA